MTRSTMDPNVEYKSDGIRSVSTGEPKEDFYDYEWNSASLRLETEGESHSVLVVLGRHDYENEWFLDVDGHPEAILNTALWDEYEQTTAELRVLSEGGRTFDYIFGVWWQDSSLVTRQLSPFYELFSGAFPAGSNGPPLSFSPDMGALALMRGVGMDRNFERDSDALSVYAQVTWNLSDSFRAILDLRHTEEDQNGLARSWPLLFPAAANANYEAAQRTTRTTFGHNVEYIFRQSRSDDSLDPSLRLQWDMGDDAMLYFAYAEGSKAGGLKANDGTLGDQLMASLGGQTALLATDSTPLTGDAAAFYSRYVADNSFSLSTTEVNSKEIVAGLEASLNQGNGIMDFEDEEAESFEVGFKSTFAQGAATLGLALFQTEFTNLQTSNYDGTRFIIGNAGSATVEGVEVEFNWLAMEGLRLHASVSAIDAAYDDWEGAQCVVDSEGMPKNDDCMGMGTSARENQAGEPLERSPDLEYNLSLFWEKQMTPGLMLKVSSSLYHSGEYFVQPTQADYATQVAFNKWDARFALADPDGRWELGLTGKNLDNKMTINHAYNIASNEFRSLSIGRTMVLEAFLAF